MDKKELLNKGLIPKYITVEQAENIEMSEAHAHDDIKQLVECKTVKSKVLDTGERVIDTLDLLGIIRNKATCPALVFVNGSLSGYHAQRPFRH